MTKAELRQAQLALTALAEAHGVIVVIGESRIVAGEGRYVPTVLVYRANLQVGRFQRPTFNQAMADATAWIVDHAVTTPCNCNACQSGDGH